MSNYTLWIVTLFSTVSMNTVFAANLSLSNTNTYKKYNNTNKPIVLALKDNLSISPSSHENKANFSKIPPLAYNAQSASMQLNKSLKNSNKIKHTLAKNTHDDLSNFNNSSFNTASINTPIESMAAKHPAVDSKSCSKLIDTNKSFVLALKKGENITKAITQCVNDANISSASLSGIGTLENPTLTYYNMPTKLYIDKTLKGTYELDSIDGNITEVNGKFVANIHASLSDSEYHTFGGHLLDGKVASIAEITITPMEGKIVKKMDNETGLETITTQG